MFYMCLAEYVNTYVVKELKASGQMLNSLIQLSVGKIIGGMLGGVYAAHFGFQSAFLVLAVMGGLSTVAFYMVDRRYGVFAKLDSSQL